MALSLPSYLTTWLTPVSENLRRGSSGRSGLVGVHGPTGALALTLLDQFRSAPSAERRSWLILTTTNEAAERLYDDLRFFHQLFNSPADQLIFFPKWETLPYESTAPNVELIARRMRALQRLHDGERTMLVTSVPALIQRVMPLEVFSSATFQLKPTASIEREPLISGLLRLGYQRSTVVEIPGQFSIRGGIVDIFSTAYPDPLRVEFLGDTIESVRFFDPATQKSTDRIREASVLPARELIRSEGTSDALRPLAPDAEWRAPSVYDHMDTLLDYFQDQPILALNQPAALKEEAADCWAGINEGYLRHEDRTASDPYPTPDHLYVSWEALLDRTRDNPCLVMEPVAAPDDSWEPIITLPTQTPASLGKRPGRYCRAQPGAGRQVVGPLT